MPYLNRRIEHLIEILNAGKLHVAEGVDQTYFAELKNDMAKVQRLPSGDIDLETCSPLLRSFARMTYMATSLAEAPASDHAVDAECSLEELVAYQRSLFELLDDIFKRVFGKSASEFATPHDFVDVMKKSVPQAIRGDARTYREGLASLHDFYGDHMLKAFAMAQSVKGMKLVFGGSSRFTPVHLDALQQTLLYGDTFLIPDPVLPWLEVERSEERFAGIQPLVQMHALLHLKPLVDADLPYPAIVVFPSFERLLVQNDPITKDRIGKLILDFFAHYLELDFEDETEIARYVNDNEDRFLEVVERKKLFVAPNKSGNATLQEMLAAYLGEIHTWRSEQQVQIADRMPHGVLAMQGILERLEPQYHLWENSEELDAEPMMCMDAHWHYFKMCADIYNGRLINDGILSSQSLVTLRALEGQEFQWLTNVPIPVLAQLRAEGANEQFRQRISEQVALLSHATLGDLDKVAYEVGRGIESLLRDHEKELGKLERDFRSRYALIGLGTLIGTAPLLYPALAPLAGVAAPLTLAAAYGGEKVVQIRKRRELSRSLTGVLAAAKQNRK